MKDEIKQKTEYFNNLIEEKDKEIEKLNDLLHKANDEVVSYADACIRLNNIIEELEKYMSYERINNSEIDEWTIMEIQMKLKTLKEGEK